MSETRGGRGWRTAVVGLGSILGLLGVGMATPPAAAAGGAPIAPYAAPSQGAVGSLSNGEARRSWDGRGSGYPSVPDDPRWRSRDWGHRPYDWQREAWYHHHRRGYPYAPYRWVTAPPRWAWNGYGWVLVPGDWVLVPID
ncbi:MAG TPA: hypothetical protein VGX21_20830 [Methylomirabilota bacterium]|jgi:hypothetical protein|nr:hypothetical protein [Methylomirabilota bacterium]